MAHARSQTRIQNRLFIIFENLAPESIYLTQFLLQVFLTHFLDSQRLAFSNDGFQIRRQFSLAKQLQKTGRKFCADAFVARISLPMEEKNEKTATSN